MKTKRNGTKKHPDGFLTAAELAAHFNRTTACISQWTGEGMPVADTVGRQKYYDPAVCQKWFEERFDSTVDGELDLAQEKAALAREQRIKVQMENQKRRGELVESSEVERDLAEFLVIVKSGMEGIPARVIDRLEGAPTKTAKMKVLLDEIRDTLRKARSGLERWAGGGEAPPSPLGPPESPPAPRTRPRH